MAGRELRRRGLTASLAVYEDDEMLDVVSETVITSPMAENAEVRISDDGTLSLERDYWPDYAVVTWEPVFSWDLRPQLDAVAGAITQLIRLAVRELSLAATDRGMNGARHR